MSFLSALFTRATMVPASPTGDRPLYLKLQSKAVAILNQEGYTSANGLVTLENDNGFFKDIFTVFCGPAYEELRRSDPRAFVLSVASSSMLGGMYAYFCAKIIQKPLYGDYGEVISRFRDYGPLPCVMRFIRNAFDHKSPEELSAVIDSVVDGISGGCQEGDGLCALARVMYDTGMTMGTYYLK